MPGSRSALENGAHPLRESTESGGAGLVFDTQRRADGRQRRRRQVARPPAGAGTAGSGGSIAALLEHEGWRVEAVFPTESGADLAGDFMTVITSMAARLYGRRHAKGRATQIHACVKRCIEQAERTEDR